MDVVRTRNPAVVAIGLVLIAVGALFLLAELGLDVASYGWPFFVIGPGLLFFFGMIARGRRGAPLAIPGSIVTTVGLILLYQNTFDHWESWAYAWTLIFPTALGIGMIVQGIWGGQPPAMRTGVRFAMIGVILFLALAAFFEGVLNLSGFADTAWVVCLAAAGLVLAGLLVIGSGLRARRTPEG